MSGGDLKWSLASMLWVGSEEVGSFQTRYCAWSVMTSALLLETFSVINRKIGLMKGYCEIGQAKVVEVPG